VENNPVGRLDPLGLIVWTPILKFAWDCAKSVSKAALFGYLEELIKQRRACELGESQLWANAPKHREICAAAQAAPKKK
jgi:hypothetical protein